MRGLNITYIFQAGNKVLLKAVIQAISTYNVSVFQLPKTFYRKINLMILRAKGERIKDPSDGPGKMGFLKS